MKKKIYDLHTTQQQYIWILLITNAYLLLMLEAHAMLVDQTLWVVLAVHCWMMMMVELLTLGLLLVGLLMQDYLLGAIERQDLELVGLSLQALLRVEHARQAPMMVE